MSLASVAPDPGRVRLRTEPEGITWVEMIDPDGPNALSPPFVSALLAGLEAASLGKVILLSGLPEVFCSGASPALLGALVRGEIAPTELGLTRVLLDLPVPVIAACEGAAIGGGFALALACDLLVLAEESRYGLNFMSLGFTPGMGTTRLAEHVLGAAIAHELLYTGEFRRGSELRSGVNAVVPRTEVPAKALDLALRIAGQPREAIVLLKRTLTLPRRRALQEALTLESFMHGITLPPLAGRFE